jgi:hypothetical protein
MNEEASEGMTARAGREPVLRACPQGFPLPQLLMHHLPLKSVQRLQPLH